MRNERQVIEYMESLSGLGIVPGLDSIRTLCEKLGNPQDKLTFVHVAGTNGKGSVCAYMASVLKHCRIQTGRYLSPTIFRYRERIQVNDKCISVEALCRLTGQVREACDEMVREGLPHPTAFEMETVIGFLYFLEKGCDIVILEAGMGGLMDATNLIHTTCLAVLTSVSMDHMKFLGDSLEKIAIQKAGIIKPGCRVVTINDDRTVLRVIEQAAQEKGCRLDVVCRADIRNVKYGLEKQRFDYGGYRKLEISLAGRYQIENCALAVKALQILSECGFAIPEEKLRLGLLKTRWPGRFTVIGRKPWFLADGAHNEDAAKRLAESITFYFTNKRIIYIMGVLKDKEYEKIIDLTCHLADQILTVTTPENPRALPAHELAQAVMRVNPNVTETASLEEAVEIARLLAAKDDVIIAFGSLSFLGRLMKIAGYEEK